MQCVFSEFCLSVIPQISNHCGERDFSNDILINMILNCICYGCSNYSLALPFFSLHSTLLGRSTYGLWSSISPTMLVQTPRCCRLALWWTEWLMWLFSWPWRKYEITGVRKQHEISSMEHCWFCQLWSTTNWHKGVDIQKMPGELQPHFVTF
jgi:hypothetical protein